jgi:hypothetical protein
MLFRAAPPAALLLLSAELVATTQTFVWRILLCNEYLMKSEEK